MPYSRGKVGFSFGGKCTGRGLVIALQVWTDGQRNVQNWRGCADCTLECLHYQHASVTSQHHVVQCVWGRAKKKNSYHVCITFRHITFGRTPGVLAILTRPLHTQRAKNTEGVNQSSCTVGKSRNQETVYSGKIHTQRTPQHSSQGSLLLTNSSELTSGLMGKQTNRITLKAYEIHPPPQLLL